MSTKTPHVLVILDGWGYREASDANAIHMAKTPIWDQLWTSRPHGLISGSGVDVGLPVGQMGNSEVGHMNLGAGRVIYQDFTRINKAIDDESFFSNKLLCDTSKNLSETNKTLHIFGLLSAGGVHSHQDHIKAMVKLAFEQGVENVYVHAFLDGRDVAPKCALASITMLETYIKSLGNGGIASIIGRYYAMDRDNRWERIESAYNLIAHGKGDYHADDPITALNAAYARGETDEFVKATAIHFGGDRITLMTGDAVVFMNFRADRARELSHAFIDSQFDGFERSEKIALSEFVCLTQYAADINCPCAYTKEPVKNSIGEYISSLGKTQIRLAETEKYAHVTFFFSGGRELPFPGESRTLIPSPNVATYDLQPTMSAPELTDRLVDAINAQNHDLIIVNFANGDMVGHTGNLKAAIIAVECLDQCLERIQAAVNNTNGHCLITADHGNVEQMVDTLSGQAHTAHTAEYVPLVYLGHRALTLKAYGVLSDIAPTMLDLMSIPQPLEMTGQTLLKPIE